MFFREENVCPGLGPITQNQINYNYNYFQLFSTITITLLIFFNQLQLHHFNYNYICIMENHLLINLCTNIMNLVVFVHFVEP